MRYVTTEVIDGKILYKVETNGTIEPRFFKSKQEAEDYLVDLENGEQTPVDRSSRGIKNILFDTLDSILDGTADKAKTGQIIATCTAIEKMARLELDYAKFKASKNSETIAKIEM